MALRYVQFSSNPVFEWFYCSNSFVYEILLSLWLWFIFLRITLVIIMLFLPQGPQGLPGKPVRSFVDNQSWFSLIVFSLVSFQSPCKTLLCNRKILCDRKFVFITFMNWKGEDGEPGYPGAQGPPGEKVPISFVIMSQTLVILNVYIFMHWPRMFV